MPSELHPRGRPRNGPSLAEAGTSETDDRRTADSRKSTQGSMKRECRLAIHDATFSKEDALVNTGILPTNGITFGGIIRLSHLKEIPKDQPPGEKVAKGQKGATTEASHFDQAEAEHAGNCFLRPEPMTQDMLSKQPHLEISVSFQVANTFNFSKGNKVLISAVDEDQCSASHVEIVFRDQYLARADMWRLVNSELAGKCLYRGQKIAFMDSIKATIKSIFVRGKKVLSASFSTSTKPVFRSESARYVLFIQMSKEMWDFDSEGSGEIMFDKVINGFLPELFKRWQQMQVRHLVSIVLFTRMLYDDRYVARTNETGAHGSLPNKPLPTTSKDFYRVVVSDMASGESADILTQLKKEFKVFSRDVSIRTPESGDFLPLDSGLSGANSNLPDNVIAGYPSDAAHGNVLEAINLASSQFSSDYIDRDLVRTGVSIVVISPGTGFFEVGYDLLTTTTDNLIDNGVGIDLVCLSRMPLHSVPLFQYPNPENPQNKSLTKDGHLHVDKAPPHNSTSFSPSFSNNSEPSFSPASYQDVVRGASKWSYGIPHWVDVSFWAPFNDVFDQALDTAPKIKSKAKINGLQHKPFIPRIRMYEVQMMGVMDSAGQEISVAHLDIGPNANLRALPQRELGRDTRHQRLGHVYRGSTDVDVEVARSGKSTLSTSPSSILSRKTGPPESLLQSMDDYDNTLFIHPRANRRHRMRTRQRIRHLKESHQSVKSQKQSYRKSSTGVRQRLNSSQSSAAAAEEKDAPSVTKQKDVGGPKSSQKIGMAPRSISFGLRGLAPSTKSVASAKVDNVQSSTWTTKLKDDSVVKDSDTDQGDFARLTDHFTASSISNNHPSSDTESGPAFSSDSEYVNSSKPIPIGKSALIRRTKSRKEGKKGEKGQALPMYDRLAALTDVTNENVPRITEKMQGQDVKEEQNVLSPRTTLAPWLTVLNPSNPSKTNAARTSRLGRWQHIFPRPPKTSQIKWKSLCSPAAVPLTTEDFPTTDQLLDEYKDSSYSVLLPEEMDLAEKPCSIVHEILSLRLSRGFQIVVGSRLEEACLSLSLKSHDTFSESMLIDIGSTIFLTRGNTIHQLTRTGIDRLQIRVLVRHTAEATREDTLVHYSPLIRSMLADAYQTQDFSIMPQRNPFNWDMIDSFIVGNDRPEAAQYVESLRPWRARFVLIPVEPSASARRIMRPTEDNEEEIRLEGIRKLSQLWQRFRYIPPEDRAFQPLARKTKDPNPLDITYHTKDPSAIVAAELESMLEGDETGRPVQLLPEPDLYQRSNLELKFLAETIQGEKGVRMLDRRWHFRLHYNCFIGMELTSWLLQNFRDVFTREEAELLGKDLMSQGLFKHVEQRHDFRDGNYFYQIESEYRTPRPESKSWFGRSRSSVPSTPMTESHPEPSKMTRSRASSNADTTSDAMSSLHAENKGRPTVALSKSLLYNVDHRRRSYRPEIVNLHYDRFHNPDNCYHIRLEWMNTTPRLIQEAVTSWATSVDRYGLRLVEIPIGEASSITSMHPFRAPYEISLALAPPIQQPQNFFDATAFLPQTKKDPLFYQKAILKHFNFVLDYEAASAYPPDVDVSYSWGKADYRYPQYLHRTGTLIAQITDEGNFLFLANRLYNNRGTPTASASASAPVSALDSTEASLNRPISRSAFSTLAQRSSPHASPYTSPSLRPATTSNLDVPASNITSRGPTPTSTSSNTAAPLHHSRSPTATNPNPGAPSITPETLTREIQQFCHDSISLEKFYTEVLSKSSTPSGTPLSPATAGVNSGGGRTPMRTPLREVKSVEEGEEDSGIPRLDLPGRLVEKGG